MNDNLTSFATVKKSVCTKIYYWKWLQKIAVLNAWTELVRAVWLGGKVINILTKYFTLLELLQMLCCNYLQFPVDLHVHYWTNHFYFDYLAFNLFLLSQ